MIIYNNQAANNGEHTLPYEVKMGFRPFCIGIYPGFIAGCAGLMDVNASTETAYPNTNGNSMNKKLEAAKKWLKERQEQKKNA